MTTLEDKSIWEDADVSILIPFRSVQVCKVYKLENGTCFILVILPLTQASIDDEVLRMSTDEIISRTRLLENDIKVWGDERVVLVL